MHIPASPAARRAFWQEKLSRARAAYADELARMERREALYMGERGVQPAPGARTAKPSSNVRNIVYELIESQVDSTIPLPRVQAVHPGDEPLARAVEDFLRSEVQRLDFTVLGDLQERTVPIQGGGFWQVEWDPAGGSHCCLGALAVQPRHPRCLIPQPGVAELEDMDYLFLQSSQTKEAVRRRWGKDVSAAAEEEPDLRPGEAVSEELVTVNAAYYRGDAGRMGLFVWVEDTTLADWPDWQARSRTVCAGCGSPKTAGVCPVCGGKRFEPASDPDEPLLRDVTLPGGEVLRAVVPGQRGFEVTRIPSYRPGGYPFVVQRNVRRFGSLLGASDVDVVADQQETIKKLGSKIDEKILKGGSFVTLPQGVGVETTDRELKIIRLKNPAEKALIDVLNVQPDPTRERLALEDNYAWAKSTLGITDAYQGKYDPSAMSGAAKQFSAGQAAGRLESKRRMKNAAFAALYRMMFRHLLAYARQPVPYTAPTADGGVRYAHFDPYDFLRRDAAGQLYWNDEFLFSVDPSATLAANRETLWAMIDLKYQAGAFGPHSDPRSQLRLWTLLAAADWPHAGEMRDEFARAVQAGENAAKGGEEE
ncbi:MAG: hypothetical protein IJ484_01315 [Oscillospiraceae bacterium]|nr:hypothetical protein [Oscillospiraceae bacterium]